MAAADLTTLAVLAVLVVLVAHTAAVAVAEGHLLPPATLAQAAQAQAESSMSFVTKGDRKWPST